MSPMLNDDEFEKELMQRLAAEQKGEDELSAAEALETDDAADLQAMEGALGSYRAQSLDWAEQKSAAMPSPLPKGARTNRPAWLQAPQWALGTAAFCACLAGGALYNHHQNTLLEQAAITLPAAPTQQALAADNQLLSSVDEALSGSVAPSERELGLTDDVLGDRAQTRHPAQPRSN